MPKGGWGKGSGLPPVMDPSTVEVLQEGGVRDGITLNGLKDLLHDSGVKLLETHVFPCVSNTLTVFVTRTG